MEWTGARYADAPTVELAIWIDSPPERVWAVVTALEELPALSDELQAIEWCDGATAPALGARFVGHSEHRAIGTWSTTSTIVECDPPTALAWAVGDPRRTRRRLAVLVGTTGRRRHLADLPGPARARLFRAHLRDRTDARQGAADRPRPAARVRGRHLADPVGDQGERRGDRPVSMRELVREV